jgi:hypothetical protein
MSLAKQVKKLNLESEIAPIVDEEVVVPSIEEQLESEEAEAELVEVLDEVEENQDALEESEEVVAEIDEHIAEAEATVAEAEGAVGDASVDAEGPAAEEGETPAEASEDTDGGEVAPEDVADAAESVLDENGELPVEEVVAAQEALQNLLKRTGYTLPNRVTVSREDVRSNPLEAYKMNLEDWKDLKEKVQAGAKKIWEAIKKAYAWIKEQIAKVFPSKVQKVKSIIATFNKASVASVVDLKENVKGVIDGLSTKQVAILQILSTQGFDYFTKAVNDLKADIMKASADLTKFKLSKDVFLPTNDGILVYKPASSGNNVFADIDTIEVDKSKAAAALPDIRSIEKLGQQYINFVNNIGTTTKAIDELLKKAETEDDKVAANIAKGVVKVCTSWINAANKDFYLIFVKIAKVIKTSNNREQA